MPLETASYFNSRPRERPTLWFFHAPCNTYISTHDLVRGRHGTSCIHHNLGYFNSRPRERPTSQLLNYIVKAKISTHDLVRGRPVILITFYCSIFISTHDLVRGRPRGCKTQSQLWYFNSRPRERPTNRPGFFPGIHIFPLTTS